MHFGTIPGNTVHQIQHSIWVFPFSSQTHLLDNEPLNFKPIWMNKLDRKQKSNFEISSNESHLGQATWKKQKLALCKSNTLQEMRKLAAIATRKPVFPKMAELSQPVSSPPHPWGLPQLLPCRCWGEVLIFLAPWDSSGISNCSRQHTPSHPSPTPRQINPR